MAGNLPKREFLYSSIQKSGEQVSEKRSTSNNVVRVVSVAGGVAFCRLDVDIRADPAQVDSHLDPVVVLAGSIQRHLETASQAMGLVCHLRLLKYGWTLFDECPDGFTVLLGLRGADHPLGLLV